MTCSHNVWLSAPGNRHACQTLLRVLSG